MLFGPLHDKAWSRAFAHVSLAYALICGALWIVAVRRRGEPIKALEGAVIVFFVLLIATIQFARLMSPRVRAAIAARPMDPPTRKRTLVLIGALSIATGLVPPLLIPGKQGPLLFALLAWLVFSRLHSDISGSTPKNGKRFRFDASTVDDETELKLLSYEWRVNRTPRVAIAITS